GPNDEPVLRAKFANLRPSIQRYAASFYTAEFSVSPQTIRYQPAYSQFFDRLIINMAEVAAPIYRTYVRLRGLGDQLTTFSGRVAPRVDLLSNLDGITRIMD